jgi:hypothetical protein
MFIQVQSVYLSANRRGYEIFDILHITQTGSETHPASLTMTTWGIVAEA